MAKAMADQGTRTVFETEARRRSSRASYIFMLKLLVPLFLALMGLGAGMALTGAGLPGVLGGILAVVLAVGLPWLAIRAMNRRLRFTYTLKADGLEVGPLKRGWFAPYDEVALIRESHEQDVSVDRYLEVIAGSRSATVILTRTDVRACAKALADRCPSAVWVDDQGNEHLSAALKAGRGGPDVVQRALRNMEVLRHRYVQGSVRLIAAAVLAGVVLTYVGAAFLGLVRMDEGLRKGLGISSLFFTGLFGACGFMQVRQLKAWDAVRERFEEAADENAPRRGD